MKKVFPLFFVIDTSGATAGEYISSIKEGMEEKLAMAEKKLQTVKREEE